MKKMILSAILPFATIFATASAATAEIPQGAVVTETKGGSNLTYDHLSTEAAWQDVLLPPEVYAALGSPRQIQLSVKNLPSNVHVALMPHEGTNTVGFNIWRSNKGLSVNQKAIFTLTNPASHYSYTFQDTVFGQ